jgi:uncharacterized protein
MKRIIWHTLIIIGFVACNNTKSGQEKAEITQTQKAEHMKNIISIVEIPVTDFPRAVKFYQTILGITIQEVDMGGTQMGVFPSEDETVNIALAKGSDYKPTTEGAVLYLNAGKDLQPMLDKIERNGGQVIVPKTQISPEMGYFALFIDTEGNKLGLHSAQ